MKLAKRTIFFLLALLFIALAEGQAQPTNVLCKPIRGFDPAMCLSATAFDDPLSGRIPVILIHGLNRNEIPGRPDITVWSGLMSHLQQSRWFREKHKLYYLSYLSNVESVRDLGLDFGDLINQMDQADPDFRGKPLVIIAHSMGGLIARSYMQEPRLKRGSEFGGDRVLRLITLGTPHHGTPISNGPARDHKAGFLSSFLFDFIDHGLFNDSLTWSTDNRSDLRWDNYDRLLDYGSYPESNLWLEWLNSGNTFEKKIVAYGGTVEPFSQIDDCLLSGFRDPGCLAGIMKNALGMPKSDGVVPLNSALFYPCKNCAGTRIYPGYDHSEIVNGKSNQYLLDDYRDNEEPLFKNIAGDLLSLNVSRTTGFDNYADLGDPADERFHSLSGWGKVNPGLLPWPDIDRSSRYQSLRGESSVDLFVQEPLVPYRLTFRSEAGYCDDSFTVYLNGWGVFTYEHNGKPDFPIHSIYVDAGLISDKKVRITFKNIARDNCGLAAIYYVRLDPM